MINEIAVFEEYAQCIQECLKNVLYDNQMADDEKPVIVYAAPPVAWSKINEHFANGKNVGPIITFRNSGISVEQNEQMGGWKYMPVERKQGDYIYRAPVICKLTYTVMISALTQLQADALLVQLMQATPFHRPYYTKYNGNYVTIHSSDYDIGESEAGEEKDQVITRKITLTIDRAYINYDIKELYAGEIYPEDNSDDYSGYDIAERYKNGSFRTSSGEIVNGKVVKNSSNNGYSPFNYRIMDKDGNVIDTAKIGKMKVRLYSVEGVK